MFTIRLLLQKPADLYRMYRDWLPAYCWYSPLTVHNPISPDITGKGGAGSDITISTDGTHFNLHSPEYLVGRISQYAVCRIIMIRERRMTQNSKIIL